MANPNNITLRSDKESPLTWEEMDLNMVELQNVITEFDQFTTTTYAAQQTQINDLTVDFGQLLFDVSESLTLTDQEIEDLKLINNQQSQKIDDIEFALDNIIEDQVDYALISARLQGVEDDIDQVELDIGVIEGNISTIQTKLNTIQENATQNASDAYLLNRQNHTGLQDISTIDGLDGVIDGIIQTVDDMIGDLGDLSTKDKVDNTDWEGEPLSIANGGTGATSAEEAREALGIKSNLFITVSEENPTGGVVGDIWLKV